MASFDSCHSDSSDYIDSEVEYELYSQIHYSQVPNVDKCAILEPLVTSNENKQLVVKDEETKAATVEECPDALWGEEDGISDFEEWELLNSKCNAEEEIRKTNKNLEIHIVNGAVPSDPVRDEEFVLDDDPNASWDVDNKDVYTKSNFLRYFGKSSKRCRKCGESGHVIYDCPKRSKSKLCYLCGHLYHSSWACQRSKRANCFMANRQCHRCGASGHEKKHCPDIWRQFHVTVKPGSIVTHALPLKTSQNAACFLCCMNGHAWYECEAHVTDTSSASWPLPVISRYDHWIRISDSVHEEKNTSKTAAKPNLKRKIASVSEKQKKVSKVADELLIKRKNLRQSEEDINERNRGKVLENCTAKKNKSNSLGTNQVSHFPHHDKQEESLSNGKLVTIKKKKKKVSKLFAKIFKSKNTNVETSEDPLTHKNEKKSSKKVRLKEAVQTNGFIKKSKNRKTKTLEL